MLSGEPATRKYAETVKATFSLTLFTRSTVCRPASVYLLLVQKRSIFEIPTVVKGF